MRSRVGGFPDVIGNLPAALLPQEIETPGPLQVRALFVSAGNPVLSVPDGDALERALGSSTCFVSLDFYVNETNRHADYVLPATTFRARRRAVAFLGFYTTPFIQHTDAVVPPAGEAREEWEVIDAIARRIGVAPYSVPAAAAAGARWACGSRPRRLVDLLLRTGPSGDLFGLRRSGSASQAARPSARHGARRARRDRGAAGKLRTRPKRVRLCPPEIAGELERLRTANGADPDFPLLLIGLRELRSHNSWMHNAPLLMRGGRVQALRVHPDDAAAHGLEDGGRPRSVEVGLGRGAGEGDRRDDAGHGRAAARLGPPRRLAARQRERGRQREPAGQLRSRGPRAAGRDGAPERHPGARDPVAGGSPPGGERAAAPA